MAKFEALISNLCILSYGEIVSSQNVYLTVNQENPVIALSHVSAKHSDKVKTGILDQVPAPSHMVMVTLNLIFAIIFSHSILLHSIWRQAIETRKNIYESK